MASGAKRIQQVIGQFESMITELERGEQEAAMQRRENTERVQRFREAVDRIVRRLQIWFWNYEAKHAQNDAQLQQSIEQAQKVRRRLATIVEA